jgi:hypothetical protein
MRLDKSTTGKSENHNHLVVGNAKSLENIQSYIIICFGHLRELMNATRRQGKKMSGQ